MSVKINLSELSGFQLLHISEFSGKRLLENLMEHPIASLYPLLNFLDSECIMQDDFLAWERKFSIFMEKEGFLVLLG